MGTLDGIDWFAAAGIDDLLKKKPERVDCGELVEVDGVYVPAE